MPGSQGRKTGCKVTGWMDCKSRRKHRPGKSCPRLARIPLPPPRPLRYRNYLARLVLLPAWYARVIMRRWFSLLAVLAWAVPGRAADMTVDYLRDVKPILARHCYACHGVEKQRSGLRLDTAARALAGGNSGAAIVPGKSRTSRLIQAVTGQNDVKLMPPKEPRLDAKEIALLKAWIDQGAKSPAKEAEQKPGSKSSHWSFVPPRRGEPPAVKNKSWVRNP